MTAKLERHGEQLMLGGRFGWTLGAVRRKERGLWFPVLNRVAGTRTGYDSITDARQDLEAEVRRLLNDAGVDVQ